MSVKLRALTVALAVLMALPALSRAEQRVLTLDPAATKVSFTLDATGHDVEGTLSMKSGRITFDTATGAASGEIVLNLQSAQTGSESRDKTMHEDVLETAKYPLTVFRAEKIEGTVAVSGSAGSSQITLLGTLVFHGGEHKIKLPAKVDVQNGKVTAEARFAIPYVAWGLHDPSIMILRVAKEVALVVNAHGSMETGEAPAGKS